MKGGDVYAFPSWRSSQIFAGSSEDAFLSARSSPSCAALADRVPDVKCLDPYVSGRAAFPCGRCGPCRVNRRRIWTHRIMLEAMQHAENAFVTLTYGAVHPGQSLSPDDLSKWLKRLRERIYPRSVRYFAVGEYGPSTLRPHYHAAMFGYPCCSLGPVVRAPGGGRECRCYSCANVRDSWGFGHIMVGTLEMRSAQYVAGYVTKKFKEKALPSDLVPPFARMSLKPGIGAGAVPDVASALLRWKLEQRGDVPITLRHGSTLWPIGRYLRRRLRKEVGLDEKCPEHVLDALRTGLLPVFEAAEAVAPGAGQGSYRRLLVKNAIAEENEQVGRNAASREVIKPKGVI